MAEVNAVSPVKQMNDDAYQIVRSGTSNPITEAASGSLFSKQTGTKIKSSCVPIEQAGESEPENGETEISDGVIDKIAAVVSTGANCPEKLINAAARKFSRVFEQNVEKSKAKIEQAPNQDIQLAELEKLAEESGKEQEKAAIAVVKACITCGSDMSASMVVVAGTQVAKAIAKENRKCMNKHFEGNKSVQENYAKAELKLEPKKNQEMKKNIIKLAPKDVTEEEIKKVIEICDKAIEEDLEDINEFAESCGFSEEVKEQVRKQSEKVLVEIRRQSIIFLQEFFKSETGRAIRKRTKQTSVEVKEAKTECRVSQANSGEAFAAARKAKKIYEKAIEDAAIEKKKAKDIVARCGYKPLDNNQLYEVLQKEAPMQAYKFLLSQSKAEEAKRLEYEANATKEHAEFLEDITKKYFEFTQAKLEAAMLNMKAMLYK
ncbi:MAG: hypothetical protein K6A44_06905 [bacterium]|nr:hypothetical protein [bacterium]